MPISSPILSLRSETDFNDIEPNLDSTDPFRFSHGLTGVDQIGNYFYDKILIYMFVGLAFFTVVVCIGEQIGAFLRRISTVDTHQSQRIWSMNLFPVWSMVKKHLVYAPLWKHRHNRELQLSKAVGLGTLPSRLHIILIISYVLANIGFCLAIPWDGSRSSVTAALRGRSGHLATLNLIPTILFALRNNPMIWLLRVSYDTFNLLHRWVARIVIFESIMHVACWLANTYNAGSWDGVGDAIAGAVSYRWGLVGSIVFVFVGLQAWSPLRHAFYDTFLNIHRISALTAVVAVYMHLNLHTLPQQPFIYTVFALWGFEYVLRAISVVYYNIRYRQLTTITVEALPGETSRVTISLVRPWTPRPGAHLHIYVPRVSYLISHPFSVAWYGTRLSSPSAESLPMTHQDIHLSDNNTATNTLSLLVARRTGFTRRIYDLAAAQPSGIYKATALIESPYGGQVRFDSYGTVLLFAGGVGITAYLTHARALVQGSLSGTASARKVVFAWAVRDLAALEWAADWLEEICQLGGGMGASILKVRIFASARQRTARGGGDGETATEQQLSNRRCNVGEVMDYVFHDRDGAMVVGVCGPGPLSDEVRACARKKVTLGWVDFEEEAFTY
ncbi:hypothetical protein BDY21DRAFT_285235 [Lineolata rhizophorae]|uniref:FAD-binding FR-type domain-containing protein n=1 Tax=Lineolata rhizophorae TaxID=578093 RepID=A0A6A6P1T6_9PEZI|nr:hypothetical protein BDY21DRAFT_285235 [Lineolata rhizophorae]